MRYLSAVPKSKLLSPILLTALLPLSFRSSTTGIDLVFLGGRTSVVAIALWGLCVTMAAVAIFRSRHQRVLQQG
jgi:hypothetical protein